MGFLVHPPMLPGEGHRGYISRLATGNALDFVTTERLLEDFEALRRSDNRAATPGEAYKRHAATDSEPNLVDAIRRYRRCCPLCLRENMRSSASWERLFVDACPTHGIWLVDVCNKCGTHLKWKDSTHEKCRCGESLAALTYQECPQAVTELAASLADRQTSNGQIQGLLRPLSEAQRRRLIKFLGLYFDGGLGAKPLKTANLERMDVSWRITSIAAEVFSNWPTAFYTCLSRLKDRPTKRGAEGQLRSRFGNFYTLLYRAFPEKEFRFLKDAFESFLIENWRGNLCKRNRRLSSEVIRQFAWVPISAGAELAGISRTHLERLIRGGAVRCEPRQTCAGRTVRVVNKDDIVALGEMPAASVDLREACNRLGLHKRRLAKSISRLVPSTMAADGVYADWIIPSEKISALEAFTEKLAPISALPRGARTIRIIAKSCKWPKEDFIALLDAMLSREVMPIGRLGDDPRPKSIVFLTTDIEAWRKRRRDANSPLTVPEAAERLKVKQEVAYHLVNKQLLQVTRDSSSTGGRQLSIWAVDKFAKEYVFARELAKARGTSSRKIVSQMADLGIHPVCAPWVDQCRQIVYKRNDAHAQA